MCYFLKLYFLWFYRFHCIVIFKVQIVLFALLSPPKPHLKESEFKPLRRRDKAREEEEEKSESSFLVGEFWPSDVSYRHLRLVFLGATQLLSNKVPTRQQFHWRKLSLFCFYSTYDQFPKGLISCFSSKNTTHIFGSEK